MNTLHLKPITSRLPSFSHIEYFDYYANNVTPMTVSRIQHADMYVNDIMSQISVNEYLANDVRVTSLPTSEGSSPMSGVI